MYNVHAFTHTRMHTYVYIIYTFRQTITYSNESSSALVGKSIIAAYVSIDRI